MKSKPLLENVDLPLLIEPSSRDERSSEALIAWAGEEGDWIRKQLLERGALLFRGFDLEDPQDFERFCKVGERPLMRYVGGDSPRKHFSGDLYTSTEYPRQYTITLHGEMSYAAAWPERVFFYCHVPPDEGGETPIASARSILEEIAPEVRTRFAEKGIRYVSNLHGGWGFGKSWMEAFETEDRNEVEAHCNQHGLDFEWNDKGGLRTTSLRPALTRHPTTGAEVWFNQADQWHVSSLGPEREQALLKVMTEHELPRHAWFGDGSRIDAADLEEFRRAADAVKILFPWQQGDVLLVDNVLVAHGRRPFSGPRRILVAMQ